MKRRVFLNAGFTLIEVLLAAAASAVIFAAVYGVFSRAVKLRDQATVRVHDSQLRMRATNLLRDDLRNGYFSGGLLASSLEGNNSAQQAGFPGYLRFTTTTGRGSVNGIVPDVQEVEYYIAADPGASDRRSGMLVRTTNDDLLELVKQKPVEQPLLKGVSGMEVSFYDGQSWVDSWDAASMASANTTTAGATGSTPSSTAAAGTTTSVVPVAVRVRLLEEGATSSRNGAKPLAEMLVPWAAQPFITQ